MDPIRQRGLTQGVESRGLLATGALMAGTSGAIMSRGRGLVALSMLVLVSLLGLSLGTAEIAQMIDDGAFLIGLAYAAVSVIFLGAWLAGFIVGRVARTAWAWMA